MAIRVRGRRRSLSKKVSSFNMYDDQVYQIRAIMEAMDEQKDAPVIRQLLDEALGARRRKALGIADWEEPPGQEDKETFKTISVLLLKLLKHEEKSFMARDVGLLMLRELLVETRACRDLVYEENVRNHGWKRERRARPWITSTICIPGLLPRRSSALSKRLGRKLLSEPEGLSRRRLIPSASCLAQP